MGHRPGLSLRTQGSFGRQSPLCCLSAPTRRRPIGARNLLKAGSARSTTRRGGHSSSRRRTRTHSGGLNDDRHGSGRRDCRRGRGGCATGASETGREVDTHDRADLGLTEEVVEPQGVLHPGRGRSSPADAVAVDPVEAVCHAESVREQRGGTERWGPVSSHQARDRRMVDAGLLGQLTLRGRRTSSGPFRNPRPSAGPVHRSCRADPPIPAGCNGAVAFSRLGAIRRPGDALA
jgi:hypothetical protein